MSCAVAGGAYRFLTKPQFFGVPAVCVHCLYSPAADAHTPEQLLHIRIFQRCAEQQPKADARLSLHPSQAQVQLRFQLRVRIQHAWWRRQLKLRVLYHIPIQVKSCLLVQAQLVACPHFCAGTVKIAQPVVAHPPQFRQWLRPAQLPIAQQLLPTCVTKFVGEKCYSNIFRISRQKNKKALTEK